MSVKVRLENFVPYDQSLQWTLHADYFKAKGRSAWTDNIIPYAATNNAPLARQHIHILFRLIKELEEAEKIDASEGIAILEVGAGSGQFSIQIFEALAHDFGDAGRRLRERITWILSDFSERTLQEATETKHVASLVAEGRVVPALYDASGQEPMRRLDGQTLQGQVIAVVASYLGCVLPFRYFRKQDNHWTECWASLSAEIEGNDLDAQTVLDSIRGGITSPVWSQLSLELDWRPVTLEDAFDDPTHARVINDATEAMDESTVGYPTVLFDALVRWKKLLVDGGLVFLSDLGKHSSLSLAGHEDPNPTIYGNTLNHSVCFALLEPLARHSNFGLLRTVDALGQLQQAICKHGPPLSQGLEDTFRTWYVESTEHQDLLDFEKAGRDAYENSDYRRSMRLYRKCLALSPRDPDLYYGLGRSCLAGGYFSEAIETMMAGFNYDPDLRLDFDFHLGRACASLGYHHKALEWYTHSVRRDPHPVTFANMAETHFLLENYDAAYLQWREALTMDPVYPAALEGMERLKQIFFQQRIATLDETGPGKLRLAPGQDTSGKTVEAE